MPCRVLLASPSVNRLRFGWGCASRIGRRLNWGAFAVLLSLGGSESEALGGVPNPEAATVVSERDLPPLPAVPKLDPPPPMQSEIDDLQVRLELLRSEKPEDRREAARDVLEVQSKSVAVVLSRLDKLAARADRDRMKRALAQLREKTRHDVASEKAEARNESGARPDLLLQLVEQARPKDEGWRDLVELVALSRMLTHIGNIYATRSLIEIYVRFGEFMRVDVQNRLADLRDRAVAALIEARRHRAEKIARWADRQLDRLGKGVPSEAIRTDDFEVLADVLRAYGRTKDPDAARIVVSYASSERFQLREAARQSIAMLGDVGLWQLRDAYENVVGRRPRRDWSWDRTARELFFEYDRLHVKKVYDLMEQGAKAASEHRYQEMAKAYDTLLARSPQFDRAHTLAPGYFEFAQQVAKDQPDVAQTALVRVERLATDPALRQRARSLRDTIRAEQYLRSGVLDAYLLHDAAERDPANRRAKELLSAGDRAAIEEKTIRVRWLTSGVVALIALTAILFMLLRRRGQPPTLDNAVERSRSTLDPDSAPAPREGDSISQPPGHGDTSAAPLSPTTSNAIPPSPELTHSSNGPTDDNPSEDESAEAPPKRRNPFEDL